ncbi:hypothetical protein HZH68_001149 [Vespula germanica]|uniref:Uncharacterized protein n=1 Tax=Vespula germanica TaxID=30212 RepID=A0A834NUZ7_VESGE|nr:hypothetical protein HZH68_001149 [Vespula germanica]
MPTDSERKVEVETVRVRVSGTMETARQLLLPDETEEETGRCESDEVVSLWKGKKKCNPGYSRLLDLNLLGIHIVITIKCGGEYNGDGKEKKKSKGKIESDINSSTEIKQHWNLFKPLKNI